MEEAAERLEAELALLHAMYPDSISHSPKSREVRYTHLSGPDIEATEGVLVLRLPDEYPATGSPDVILATGAQKSDLRSAAQSAFGDVTPPSGGEILDVLILAFQDILQAEISQVNRAVDEPAGPLEASASPKTVIIWLHHLLNTNKRKLALNPSSQSNMHPISGLVKPGYPGIMVFSGSGETVAAHVAELRAQRWQAFQVRYNSDDDISDHSKIAWKFSHGEGIAEVESMSEVVQGIVGEREREVLLSSIGVK